MNLDYFDEDVTRRNQLQPHEHPLVSRLVVLRVIMNHEFGAAFEEFDHELAQLELSIQDALRSDSQVAIALKDEWKGEQ